MAAEDGGGAGFACAAFAAVVEGGGWEVVAEMGCEVGSGAGDEGSVAVVSLIPEVAVADDAGGAAAAEETAAVGHEEVAEFVVVETPLVAAAAGEDFEGAGDRVEAPDPGVEGRAAIGGRAGFADEGGSEDPLAAVEPAVGAP